jgi:DnaJ-domain-containing protein 1
LKQHGIDIADDSAGTIDDFELLSEIMELRETIEANPPVEVRTIFYCYSHCNKVLKKLLSQNQSSLQSSFDRIGKAFENKDIEKAKNETIRVQYLKTLERELKERLPVQ